MRRKQFPLAIAIIELVAFAAWHVAGLILASLVLGAVYFVSLRTHPRIRHTGWRSCNGTGEVRHPLFPWVFHKCARCNGGRLIRSGAGQFGSEPVRGEHARAKAARKSARQNRTWR